MRKINLYTKIIFIGLFSEVWMYSSFSFSINKFRCTKIMSLYRVSLNRRSIETLIQQRFQIIRIIYYVSSLYNCCLSTLDNNTTTAWCVHNQYWNNQYSVLCNTFLEAEIEFIQRYVSNIYIRSTQHYYNIIDSFDVLIVHSIQYTHYLQYCTCNIMV